MIPYQIHLVLWFTVAIPAIVGMALFNKFTYALKMIASLMMVGLLSEVILVIASRSGANNLYIITVYTVIEVVLLTMYFSTLIKNIAKGILIGLCLALLLSIAFDIIPHGLTKWNSISSVLESMAVICLGLYFYYETATAVNTYSARSAEFWITGILLLYFMSSLVYFLLNRQLSQASTESLIMLGTIHSFVNAFCNLAYGFILWKSTRWSSLAQ